MLSMKGGDLHKYIKTNMKMLFQGTATRRLVWKISTANSITIQKFRVMKQLESCAQDIFYGIEETTISRTIADTLRAIKDAERKKVLKRGESELLRQIDSENIKYYADLVAEPEELLKRPMDFADLDD
jgi:hypothetical protein